ncbi:hypothetical protein [Kineococcus sp. R86509]|uniref:hypothetical protein n=1 Tax=Kineococcus sp. R86509 TaxID=3093851 RepID=UPI0036D3C9F6
MTTPTGHPLSTTSSAPDVEHARVLREATRVWRRAGVRSADRHGLLAELDAEVRAARENGAPVVSVLGDDATPTLRAWALERDLAGRATRAGVLVPVALAGVLLGAVTLLASLLEDVLSTLSKGTTYYNTSGGLVLTIYASSAVLSVLVPVLGCWAVLHAGGDPRAGATARRLAWALPAGEVAATALGVTTAALTGFSYAALPVVPVVVLATMAAAVVFARKMAVKRHPAPDGTCDVVQTSSASVLPTQPIAAPPSPPPFTPPFTPPSGNSW